MSGPPPKQRRGGWRRFLDWRALLGIGISVALLYYTFRDEDPAEILHELGTANPLLFLLAAAAATGVFWVRAWRWKAILDASSPNTSFRSRFGAVAIGFMGNNLLPARVGEFARAYALSRTEPVPVVASLGSLVIERLFDGVFVVLLLFTAMMLPGFPEVQLSGGNTYLDVARGVGIAVISVLAVLFILVWKPAPTIRFAERLARLLPQRMRRPIVDALEAFLSGIGALRDFRLVLKVSAWSLVLWTFNGVGFYIGFLAFGLELPFSAALFLQGAIALAVSIPSGPGFFGPFEAATQFVLVEMFGGAPARALAYAIGFHLAGFFPITFIGLYYAWRLGLSIDDVQQTEEVVEEEVEAATGVDPDNPGR